MTDLRGRCFVRVDHAPGPGFVRLDVLSAAELAAIDVLVAAERISRTLDAASWM